MKIKFSLALLLVSGFFISMRSVSSISLFLFWISSISFVSCKAAEKQIPATGNLQLTAIRLGSIPLDLGQPANNSDLPVDQNISLDFSAAVDSILSKSAVILRDSIGLTVETDMDFLNSSRTVRLTPKANLGRGKSYSVVAKETLKGANKESFPGSSTRFSTTKGKLLLDSLTIDGKKVGSLRSVNVSYRPTIKAYFSNQVDVASLSGSISLNSISSTYTLNTSLSADKKVLSLIPNTDLESFRKYNLLLKSSIKAIEGQVYPGIIQSFYTKLNSTNKFPLISDEELINLVQKQTFKYFYDFAHPISGLAPERNSTPDVVTIGGSGFGIMALIVGVERNFITRNQGVERWTKILNFLKKADRFHGVWPHWMNGATGKTIPFSANDNGGDLVESSFMIQGLITLRQYLNRLDPTENQLVGKIDSLCNEVEYDWYRQNNQNVLYWHWSPNRSWIMNHKLQGWNETLITYVLAASSTTHTIPKVVYTNGFATGGDFVNGKSYYGYQLPLGPPLGGPLFFAHYNFLGLKPTQLSDVYANYWNQAVNHSKINYSYCVANPKNFVGYSTDCWGLTASDDQSGYSAHSPTNDLGVITPTAALSSFPYTPTESMRALKFFYYKLGDRVWGNYGFYDAFNPTADWYGRSYLAIDQGPIVVMMENHRTGLLWNLFMSAPEVQQGLTKLGFQY